MLAFFEEAALQSSSLDLKKIPVKMRHLCFSIKNCAFEYVLNVARKESLH